eukprot:FR744141.1.p1 GENE.FR744141.1~~FR744141.1.p1  ORF type:complete len:193 (+),score=63.62 FR744141.1:583-1161(+)
MSELTHINCVALTARFPVGKPVVPAALMNRPTRGERRFAYWALFRFLAHWTRCARAFGCGERYPLPPRGEYRFPQNPGKPREKTGEQKARPRAGTRKKGPVGWGFSLGFPPPWPRLPKKSPPQSPKWGKTPPGKLKKNQGVSPPESPPPGGLPPVSPTPAPLPGKPGAPPFFPLLGKRGGGLFFSQYPPPLC